MLPPKCKLGHTAQGHFLHPAPHGKVHRTQATVLRFSSCPNKRKERKPRNIHFPQGKPPAHQRLELAGELLPPPFSLLPNSVLTVCAQGSVRVSYSAVTNHPKTGSWKHNSLQGPSWAPVAERLELQVGSLIPSRDARLEVSIPRPALGERMEPFRGGCRWHTLVPALSFQPQPSGPRPTPLLHGCRAPHKGGSRRQHRDFSLAPL